MFDYRMTRKIGKRQRESISLRKTIIKSDSFNILLLMELDSIKKGLVQSFMKCYLINECLKA